MPRPYPPEFRARAISLVREGRPVKQTMTAIAPAGRESITVLCVPAIGAGRCVLMDWDRLGSTGFKLRSDRINSARHALAQVATLVPISPETCHYWATSRPRAPARPVLWDTAPAMSTWHAPVGRCVPTLTTCARQRREQVTTLLQS